MKNAQYKPRLIDEPLAILLKSFGAICIEGPKWCGKTWTGRHHAQSEFCVGDAANNFSNRRLAQMDANFALEGAFPHLIDEWQDVPAIWDAVRNRVDELGGVGNFILTGSATPQRKGILHSGTGRIEKVTMRTMSLFESGESSGKISLKSLFDGDFVTVLCEKTTLDEIFRWIIRGGWPSSVVNAPANPSLLPRSYIKMVVEEDLSRLANCELATGKIWSLLKTLARNESTLASQKTLRRDICGNENEEISLPTIARHIDLLKRVFVLDNVAPFSSELRSSMRVRQSEKWHFVDPSLPAALLGISSAGTLKKDLETAGFLFESLCLRDLKIYAETLGAQVFYYRDYDDAEIDAIVQLPDGRWGAFEIKLGANQIDSAAENLLAIKGKFLKTGQEPPTFLCVISGLENVAVRREDGVFVVPICALKS